MKARGTLIKTFEGRKVGIITGVRDRREEDISSRGEEAAKIFDEIIIRHDDDWRRPTYKEMDRLFRIGIHKIDRDKPVAYYGTECKAVEQALNERRPDSVILLLIDNITAVTQCVAKYQNREKEQVVTLQKAG